MSACDTFDSADSRIHRKARRAFRVLVAPCVTVLLILGGLGQAEATGHGARAARKVEVRGTLALSLIHI